MIRPVGMDYSPSRYKRRQEFLRRQEERWRKSNGPVVVRFVDPADVRRGRPLPPLETPAAPVTRLKPSTERARLRKG